MLPKKNKNKTIQSGMWLVTLGRGLHSVALPDLLDQL